MEIKDTVAYLKLTASQSDSVSLLRVINTPARGIGRTTVEQIERYGREHGTNLWDAIEHTSPDTRGEVQLTDALNGLCENSTLFGLCFEGQHYDAGDPLGYLKANIALSLRDPLLRQPLQEYLSHMQA